MNIIKLAIISFIFFFLLITGISLFIPSHIRISKAININAGRDSVMAEIKDPEKWKNWYPGADTAELVVIDGKIKGIATNKIRGLVIKAINDSSVVAGNMGSGSKNTETGWNIIPGDSPDKITVQWYMDFHFRWYPWEKFSSLLLEKRYGPVMEKGLGNLKALLEK